MASTTSQFFRNAAIACFENARALHTEALLLHSNQHFGRALSLSIIGREEVAKGFLFVLAALKLFPKMETRLISSDRNNPLRDHQLKQLMEEYIGIGAWLVDDYFQILMAETDFWGPIDDIEWLTDFFMAMRNNSSESDLLLSLKRNRIKKFSQLDLVSVSLTPEQKKHKGFYIDIVLPNLITGPQDLSETDALIEMKDLELSLQISSRLEGVVNSEEKWKLFEDSLRRKLKK